MMKYTIECNEAQLKAMSVALEEYFRLRLGQNIELANDLAMMNYQDYTREEMHEVFDKYVMRRNNTQLVLDTAYRIATEDRGAYGIAMVCRTPTSRIVEDIWQVIRHQIWLDNNGPEEMPWSVDGREPLPQSDEPLMKVQKAD